MTNETATDDAPGSALFPEFDTLYDLIAAETNGLTDEQLDWTSDGYAWAKWSIRMQISHMASLIYRWLIVRWGDHTFPNGEHGVEDVEGLASSPYDRRMDDTKYYDLPIVLDKLREGIELTRRVLTERSVGFLRSRTVTQPSSLQWDMLTSLHPSGIGPSSEDPSQYTMALESTIRHIYYEEITHLFNIQRLKRAQGLNTVSDLPKVGYWTIDGWDVSEAAQNSSSVS